MAKTVSRRLEDLEKQKSKDGGMYIVTYLDGIYRFAWQDWEMTEAEYQEWHKTTTDDDHIILITRREEKEDELEKSS